MLRATLTSVGSADIDRKLCPVRSLLQYRKATTTPECRKGRKKRFISYKPSKSDEIKRATISSWIVKLIRLAYESEGSDPRTLELHKVSAHEVHTLLVSTTDLDSGSRGFLAVNVPPSLCSTSARALHRRSAITQAHVHCFHLPIYRSVIVSL